MSRQYHISQGYTDRQWIIIPHNILYNPQYKNLQSAKKKESVFFYESHSHSIIGWNANPSF